MLCCASCFGDHGLTKEISFLSNQTGTCDYCRSENAALVEPKQLLLKFEALLDCYDLQLDGKSLVRWLKDDWYLFSSQLIDEELAQTLIGDIFSDSGLAIQPRVPSQEYSSNRLGDWDSFRNELIHHNRFFPRSKLNTQELAALLPSLAVNESDRLPTVWFRARIQTGKSAYEPHEMMAPPPNVASHGRANPAGIPYLYVGSEVETAIAEIRPHTGEIASVAEFTVENSLELIDLRNPRQKVSPFTGIGADNVGQMRYDLEFLDRLGKELTRPVSRLATAYDYSPSQYLCEFIKKCGYDGVVFSSSVSAGINLALFYPDKAHIGAIHQHDVERVSVQVSPHR